MKVIREQYLSQLWKKRHNGLVKVITGVRRCGKSYLLGTLFRERLLADGVDSQHVIEVPLDRKANIPLRNAIALEEYVAERIVHDGRWNYVFIDEVQLARKVLPKGVDLERLAPEDREDAYVTFYDALNELRQIEKVDVYVTGSNSKTLSKDIDTNFADRGCQIRVHPFSFAEYCQALDSVDKAAAFADYLIWGGMPLAVAETDDRERAAYLKGLFKEVYERDIVERNRLREENILSPLIDVIASATGSLSNPHRLVNALGSTMKVKTNDHTVKAYLEYLKDAFLFSEAKRWDVKGKSYFDFPVKYYAEDPGLRNARLDFRDVEPSHMMENVIYNELVRRGCQVDVGIVPVVSVNKEGKRELQFHEIDFVVNRAPGKLYIQSVWRLPTEEQKEQELLPLRRSGDFFARMIVTEGMQPPQMDDTGIVHVGVIPFLLDESILDTALETSRQVLAQSNSI